MLAIICLWWIGHQLSAPTWFYVLLGINIFLKIMSFGIDMYNKGKSCGD